MSQLRTRRVLMSYSISGGSPIFGYNRSQSLVRWQGIRPSARRKFWNITSVESVVQ